MKFPSLLALALAVGLTNLAQAQAVPAAAKTVAPAPGSATVKTPAATPTAPKRKAKTGDDYITEHFRAGDSNHDGLISRAEAKAGMPVVLKNYDKIDTAKSDALTLPQVLAYFKAKNRERAAEKAKRRQENAAAQTKQAGSATSPAASPKPVATPAGGH